MKRAPCMDCGIDTEPVSKSGKPLFKRWDLYLVRDEVWAEAGMDGWDSGSLCTSCITKRLGRPPGDDDYLMRSTGAVKGGIESRVHPDYADHPMSGLGNRQARKRARKAMTANPRMVVTTESVEAATRAHGEDHGIPVDLFAVMDRLGFTEHTPEDCRVAKTVRRVVDLPVLVEGETAWVFQDDAIVRYRIDAETRRGVLSGEPGDYALQPWNDEREGVA